MHDPANGFRRSHLKDPHPYLAFGHRRGGGGMDLVCFGDPFEGLILAARDEVSIYLAKVKPCSRSVRQREDSRRART
jgi:hypothetical protein